MMSHMLATLFSMMLCCVVKLKNAISFSLRDAMTEISTSVIAGGAGYGLLDRLFSFSKDIRDDQLAFYDWLASLIGRGHLQ